MLKRLVLIMTFVVLLVTTSLVTAANADDSCWTTIGGEISYGGGSINVGAGCTNTPTPTPASSWWKYSRGLF